MIPDTRPIHLVGLYAENVKRLKVVHLPRLPERGVIEIAGKNDAGKSSLLDAVVYTLCGKKALPLLPVRQGAGKAKTVLDLGDLRVTWVCTERDAYLTVERRGAKGALKKPQDLLDSLVGNRIGFDPGEFYRKKEDEQTRTLLGLLDLPEDPLALAVQRKKLYDDRTLVNREVKTIETKLAGMAEPAEDVPDEEVSVTALVNEHARLVRVHHDNDEKRAARQRAVTEAARCADEVARLEALLATARAAAANAEKVAAALTAEVEALLDPDLTAITAQMQAAEATNALVRQKKNRATVAESLRAKQREAGDLTDAMTALDDQQRELLAAAPFPVPGLGFTEIYGDHVITFDGVPLSQCAASKRLRVSMAIAMALNPTLQLIILRDAVFLDADARKVVEEMALEHDYQVLIEVVGPGSEDAIVIEDGGVVRMPESYGSAPDAAGAQAPAAGVEW